MPVVAGVLFHLALWMLFPIFGVHLTYLCFSIGHPFVDADLTKADAALGFDWMQWAMFIQAHPLLNQAQSFSYASYWWQPFALVPVSACRKPRKRNAETFTALVVSMALTLLVATFLPAVGPASVRGYLPEVASIAKALHAYPQAQDLSYVGIVAFPSFHTVMAVLFAYAYRGIRWAFPIAVSFNALMATSVPFAGGHYLVDVLAGAAVAGCSILAANWLLQRAQSSPVHRFGEHGQRDHDLIGGR